MLKSGSHAGSPPIHAPRRRPPLISGGVDQGGVTGFASAASGDRGNDPILRRREIPACELGIDGGRMGAAIGHADARAADDVGGASFPGELCGTGPEQHRGCAGPIGRVDAGATHFEELAPEMANPGQVEFPLRAEGSQPPGVVRGQHAIGADDIAGDTVAHDHVLAPGVEVVVLPPRAVNGGPRTHFLDEDAIAEPLRGRDVA